MGLAALYVAALATSVQKDSVQAHISMQSSDTACEVMPSLLASLLKQKGWQDAGITRALAEALYSLHAHKDCNEELKSITCKCLLAARSDMAATELKRLGTLFNTKHGL